MPIIASVEVIVNRGVAPKDAAYAVMRRDIKTKLTKLAIDLNYESVVLKNVVIRGDHTMKRVITYGTFGLLHYGHINLLRRAKALGDYLIVVISSDDFNWNEKHKKCYFSY